MGYFDNSGFVDEEHDEYYDPRDDEFVSVEVDECWQCKHFHKAYTEPLCRTWGWCDAMEDFIEKYNREMPNDCLDWEY